MSTFIGNYRPANTITKDYNLAVAGQSLAAAFTNRSSFAALDAVLRTGGQTATFINQVNAAVGGSVADKQSSNNPAANTNCWYDTGTSSNQVNLTAAIAKFGATVFNSLVLDLGQTEALYLPDINTKANYKTAMNAILTALRTNVTGPTIIPIVGRRIDYGHAPGIQTVREAQLETVEALAATGGGVRAIDSYDLDLYDDVHPSNASYTIYGNRVGRAILNTYNPPQISAVARTSADLLTVTFSSAVVNTGEILGLAGRKADGSYLYLTGTIVSPTSMTVAKPAGSALPNLNDFVHLAYPYDALQNVSDISTVLKNSAGDPVRSVVKVIS